MGNNLIRPITKENIELTYKHMNGRSTSLVIRERQSHSEVISGNAAASPQITVTAQNIPKDTQVPVGTTITLEFTDTKARD